MIRRNYENGAERQYAAPEIVVIELQTEGVLCGSNEDLYENEGEW